jgi:hypothetical protein
MIASVSSGKRFGGLAAYLATGRSGQDTERVAWSEARNLSTSDPMLAGTIMQAEAAQAVQVDKPVYHIALAFDPGDVVNRDVMRRAADQLLADLGLSEHQAVIVAHQDRAHPHVHIMVNRVHPETGVAWDRSFDYRRIEESLRAQERELGVRVVPGKHAPIPEWERDGERGAPAKTPAGERTKGEEAQRRRGDAPFVDQVRDAMPALRAARNWTELHEALANRGLRMERKGQGLVIVGRDGAAPAAADGRDPEREVKASRVHRDLALRSLERRFGAAYEAPSRDGTRTTALADARASTSERQRDRPPRGAYVDAPLFRTAARAAAPDLRASQSWGELAERLERRGLRLDRSGYGVAVTDGVARVWFSDVARNARVRTLEARFGQSIGEWARERRRADLDLPAPRREAHGVAAESPGAATSRPTDRPLSASARYVVAQLGRYDRLRRVDRLVRQIGEDASRVAAARQVLGGRETAAARADADLRGGFARVYRDAGAALATFRATAERSGVAEAAAVLRRAPEQFGALHGAPARGEEGASRGLAGRFARAFGGDRGDPAALAEARAAAGNVARVAEAWGAVQRQRPAASELDGLARWEERLGMRERNVRAQYAALPIEPKLARAIATALPRVSREEIENMAAGMRPSQAALLRTFTAAHDATRGAREPVRAGSERRADYEARELAGRAVRAALRELLPDELRQLQRAAQAIHSPGTALRRAIGDAVRRELLGKDGPER